MSIDSCNNDKQGLACLKVKDNTLSNLVSSSEDANYPVENILDNHPKKVWKSTSIGEADVSFDIGGGSNSLTIFGTNAKRVAVSMTDPNAVEWEDGVVWEADVSWANVYFPSGMSFPLIQQGDTFSLWLDFIVVDGNVRINIIFYSDNNIVVSVGIILCGERTDIGVNPLNQLSEGLIDYSIVRELSNGAIYTKKRDRVRTFSGNLWLDRQEAFYVMMYEIARDLGPEPAAWKITDTDLSHWPVFGRLSNMPTGVHETFRDTNVSFNIQEVL